jgi:hypothetical protein
MEIEAEANLKETVMRIEGVGDGLRRSNAKNKLYFEQNNVIQNTNHAAK